MKQRNKWLNLLSLCRQERDLAVYRHLREHPGMRFFPYGFENFALISRTEIWGVESTSPAVRLQTEVSMNLFHYPPPSRLPSNEHTPPPVYNENKSTVKHIRILYLVTILPLLRKRGYG